MLIKEEAIYVWLLWVYEKSLNIQFWCEPKLVIKIKSIKIIVVNKNWSYPKTSSQEHSE